MASQALYVIQSITLHDPAVSDHSPLSKYSEVLVNGMSLIEPSVFSEHLDGHHSLKPAASFKSTMNEILTN